MTTDVPVGRPSVLEWLAEHGEGLIAFRRNMHAHPELSGAEHATTDLIAERLELAGVSCRRLTSGTGLIAELQPEGEPDGSPTPTFALRADIDALAMDDEKDVHYRSQVPGVAHACGHDVHSAVVLGAALYFAHHRDQILGPLRFLFQPAEERVPGGALDVLADQGLDAVGAVVGVHCDPKLDVGLVGLKSGPVTSAADMVTVTLSGPGGHTARPELTVDMASLAARVVAELPDRVAARLGDVEHNQTKIVFGAIHAGDAANVIPTHAQLRASLRARSLDVWEALRGVTEQVLVDLADESDAGCEIDYVHGVPPVVNEPGLTEMVEVAINEELGRDSITPAVQSWGGDDFAWYTREVPGCFVRLGVHDPTSPEPRLDLHAGRFDADERSIGIGVRIVTAAATRYHTTLTRSRA